MPGRYDHSAPAALCIVFVVLTLPACPPGVPSLHLIYNQGDYGGAALASYAGQQVADDFVLATGLSTVRHIQWWGLESGSVSAGGFTVHIFEDNGTGRPNSTPLYAFPVSGVSRDDTGTISTPAHGSRPIYVYSVEVMTLSLDPARTYYLSIQHDSGLWDWVQRASAPGARSAYFRPSDGSLWMEMGIDMAFQFRG